MKTVNVDVVTIHQCCSSIPLKGWQAVVDAVTLFATGGMPSSRATSSKLYEDVEKTDKSGGFGPVFLMFAEAKLSDVTRQFHEKLLSEAAAALQTRDQWSKSYDYNAMGTAFFKASVDIQVIDREQAIFGLSLSAAYVGSKPEIELAAKLGIQRALLWSYVSVQTEPIAGEQFSFDFEDMIRRLDPVLGTTDVTGMEIVNRLMANGEGQPSILLAKIDDFQVTLSPDIVAYRFEYKGRQRIDTWKARGSVLMGPLQDSYEEEGKKMPPTYNLVVSKPRHEEGPRVIFWKPEDKKPFLDLAEKIAVALR